MIKYSGREEDSDFDVINSKFCLLCTVLKVSDLFYVYVDCIFKIYSNNKFAYK